MFSPHASQPRNAIVLIFDLEGFSNFFNQPDVSDYLPAFLNHIFTAVNICIVGGDAYWLPKNDSASVKLTLEIAHQKFMGDGALLVLLPDKTQKKISDDTAQKLCNRLWNLKRNFKKILQRCSDDVPVFALPPRIRFGIARGTVLELTKQGSNESEFVGFCINLASRLQKYCPTLGFIGSARMQLSSSMLKTHGYKKIVATAIKGFPKEIVFVDENELNNVSKEEFSALFEELSNSN